MGYVYSFCTFKTTEIQQTCKKLQDLGYLPYFSIDNARVIYTKKV